MGATSFGLTEDLHDAQEYILKLRDALQVFIDGKLQRNPILPRRSPISVLSLKGDETTKTTRRFENLHFPN
ncbi:MAG: hypothetical protein H7315_19980 [Herminiimonas sp.]|nr:hypothetical protein [Herminiimonas sp.]